MHQRYFLQTAAANATASILGRLGSAAAQPYAGGWRIRLIVPFPSGGLTDGIGRSFDRVSQKARSISNSMSGCRRSARQPRMS
jgi:tripartite-type tricarboxylate transporter receptor subunit TctC